MNIFYISPLILQKLIWIPTRIILKLFGKIEIRGIENLKGIKSNVLFASNHTSELDPILLPASLPFWSRFSPIYYTSRENKFYKNSGWRQHFYGGWFFKLWGAHPVYSGLQDYEKSLVNHLKLLDDGKSIMVFPEGRITPDGSIQPARGGIGYLVERTGCLVVPVGLSGAFHMSLSDFFLRRRKIILRFGAPIYPDELDISVRRSADPDGNVFKEEADYIMGRVREVLSA